MAQKFKRVLITGTTSGLGRAFQTYYQSQGVEVIAVNRRASEDANNNAVMDVSDQSQVSKFLTSLQNSGKMPDLFILNAGINVPDNLDVLNLPEFDRVMKINLYGALTFISSLQSMKAEGKTIAVMSSTSNIVPNPGHLGYFASKLVLHETVKLLSGRDKKNRYKSVILSPVATNIMAGYPPPKGLQGKIYNALVVSSEKAVSAISAFFERDGLVFYYTKKACAFYFFVKLVLKFIPGLYSGSK